MSVTAFVWNKESHNLFDFENNQSTKKELDLDFSGTYAILLLATLSIVDNHLIALGENVSTVHYRIGVCEETNISYKGGMWG